MNFKEEEIPNELDEKEMKIPRYAGRVKASLQKRGKENLREAEIGVWVNTYDDIFSDFDSRPYSQRALSDDFLLEMKRASRDKPSGGIELHVFVPAKLRSFAHEAMIKGRLKEHFRRHHSLLHNEIAAIRKRGIMMILLGIVMIGIATYLRTLGSIKLSTNFLIVLFEPGGWFTGWTGLDQLFYVVDEKKPDLQFYEKMANCQIVFSSY